MIALINFELHEKTYTIFNAYAPITLKNKIEFFENLELFLLCNATLNSNLIICGDMNTYMREDNKKSYDGSTIKLEELIKKFNIQDSYRYKNKNKKGYTYVKPSKTVINSRIDYIFVDNSVMQYIKSCNVNTSPAPDHKAIIIEIETHSQQRGPGYWKLNASVLNETKYIEGIENIFQKEKEFGESKNIIKPIIWDMMKIKFKEFSRKYCQNRKKIEKNKIIEIEKKIEEVEENILKSNENESIKLEIKKNGLINEMNVELKHQVEACQIRARAIWTEKGEKNSTYFLSLEKKRQQCNTIEKVEKGDSFTNNNAEILEEIKQFYTHLYTSKQKTDPTIFLNNIDIENKLTEESKQKCEGYITLDECEYAMNKMNTNKAMGLDGLSIEFYKQFWKKIGQYMVDMYNECFDRQSITDSQKISILTLIHKKRK